MISESRGRRIMLGAAIIGPVLLYVALRLGPASNQTWGTAIFHFYIVSYTSLSALVVALLIFAGIGTRDTRAQFAAMAFVTMAGFFLLHGLTTPSVLIGNNMAVGWAAQLSFSSGALMMSLTRHDWEPETRIILARNRAALTLSLIAVYALFLWIAFSQPAFLSAMGQTIARPILVLVTIGAYLWSARFWWQSYRRRPDRLSMAMVIALCWLALAQVSQYEAPLNSTAWWLYHVLMLGAFILTMRALIVEYEQVRDFRLTRYFAAVGVLVSLPLVALLCELAVRLVGSQNIRWPIFGLSLTVIFLLLLALLAVVERGRRIIDERTSALQAEKQWRTDMTNLIVHDLKSPLNSVFLNLDLTLGGRLGTLSDPQRLRIENARGSAQDMVGLINNLLDVEKIEAGALDLRRTPCDLNSLLLTAMEGIRSQSDEQNIELTSEIAADLPWIPADEVLLRRVMQNLLGNALKFAPTKGRIHVEAVASDGRVVVSTSDNGPGVPALERDHIFEKFRQASGATRGGFGLGLTLCKLVVEAHGGRIWVEDAPGGGSRFVFSLPM